MVSISHTYSSSPSDSGARPRVIHVRSNKPVIASYSYATLVCRPLSWNHPKCIKSLGKKRSLIPSSCPYSNHISFSSVEILIYPIFIANIILVTMKFTSLLAAIAGAAMVLATPQASRAARGRRGVGGRNSHVRRASGGYSSPSKSVAGPGESDGSDIEYFTNWSGAIAEGNGFNYARGTFVVPVPQTPAGADPTGFYSSAVWVGIDGSLCQSGLIQTGVLLSVQAGVPQYSAWYEWYPARELFPPLPSSPRSLINLHDSAHHDHR